MPIWKINENNHKQQEQHVILMYFGGRPTIGTWKGDIFRYPARLGAHPARLYKNTERTRQKSGGVVGEIWSWLQLVTGSYIVTSCQPCNRNRLRTEVPTILSIGLYFFSDPEIPIMAVVVTWGTEKMKRREKKPGVSIGQWQNRGW